LIYSLVLLVILATNVVTVYDPFPMLIANNIQILQNVPFGPPILDIMYTGYPLILSEKIENPYDANLPLTFVYEVIDDQAGYVDYINSSNYKIVGLGNVDATNNQWIARQPGNYTFKTFVISDILDPTQVMAESISVTKHFVSNK